MMDRPHRLLRFHLVSRFALLLQASSTVALAWWAPTSLVNDVVEQGGRPAMAVLAGLTLLVVIGWLDVLINDALPDRFALLWARRRRHLGYALLGAVYLVMAFAAAGAMPALPGVAVLILQYAATGAVCAWFAWTAALRPTHAL